MITLALESPVPAVSVVMSVYNGERFLREATDSILRQTLENFELIVVDDGSTDHSRQVLAAVDDRRLTVLEQSHEGLATALNRGVDRARASLIARMDSDDVSRPERLEKQYRFLLRNAAVALVGTAARIVDYAGAEVGAWHPPEDHASICRRMIRANQFAHPTVMFRKEAFLAAGGYRQDMPFAQDYDLWLRMTPRFQVANLEELLLIRRVGPDQFGTRRETLQMRWAVKARLEALKRGDYPLSQAVDLLQPLISAALPGTVRQLGRRMFGRGKI